MNRLETLSPDLAAQLRRATAAKQHAAALAACEFGIGHARVDDPAVAKALRCLRAGDALTPENKIQIGSLAARLDEQYLDLQEAAEAGKANSNDYLRRFAEARAVAALAFLCKEDGAGAAEDAIYEAAAAAADDKEHFLAIVQAVLS
jgi:hypothetical protein